MTKKIKIFVLYVLVIYSCNDNKLRKEYYSTGELKKEYILRDGVVISDKWYHKNGQLQYIFEIKDDLKLDTLFEYYENNQVKNYITQLHYPYIFYKGFDENGDLSIEGRLFNKRKTGWWNYYKSTILEKQVYYMIEKDTSFVAQLKFFDSEGNVDESKSDYVKFIIPDTLYVGKSTGTIVYRKKLGEFSQENVCIGYGLKPDYSNIVKTRVDTFYSGTNSGFFAVDFVKTGKQNIKGFIYEVLVDEKSDTLVEIQTTMTYFDKDFFIVDRPASVPKDKVIHYHEKIKFSSSDN